MSIKHIYRTEDGCEFDDYHDALAHEKIEALKSEFITFFHIKPNAVNPIDYPSTHEIILWTMKHICEAQED